MANQNLARLAFTRADLGQLVMGLRLRETEIKQQAQAESWRPSELAATLADIDMIKKRLIEAWTKLQQGK